MSILEMLETYPKAAVVIKQWFLDRMLESLKDDSLPEDFKDYVRKQGIDNDKISAMVESNPRILFTPFDSQDVYVEIPVNMQNESATFSWSINKGPNHKWYNDRLDAERDAIKEAFKVLNDKL